MSETTIYTGIASGYSIEDQERTNIDFYGTNMQFDNLINIIGSRNTKEQTAIRLLAQHLSLEEHNKQYISEQNYRELQKIVPKEVKDLVVKYGRTGAERDKLEQIKEREREIQQMEEELNRMKNQTITSVQPDNDEFDTSNENETNQDNKNQDKYHMVSYGESLASIAAQYDLTVGELIRLNNLQGGELKVGDRLLVNKDEPNYNQKQNQAPQQKNQYHTIQPNETLFSIARQYNASINDLKAWNNLNSNQIPTGSTIIVGKEKSEDDNSHRQREDEVEYSEHVMENYGYLDPEKEVTELRSKDAIIPPGVDENDYYRTVENLTAYYQSSDSNFIYELLQYGHPHYSVEAISKAEITRVQNSDLVKVTYSSDDPGICQQTLKILTGVFINNYKGLRVTQTDQVVNYFKEEVRKANEKLKAAEDRLLEFNKSNNLINYSEQTEAIAVQKEELDKTYQDKMVDLQAARASLDKLESKLMKKDSIFLKSDMLTNKRNELSKVTEKLIVNEVAQDYDEITSRGVRELRAKKARLEDEIKLYLDQLFMYQQTIEGIPIDDLLNNWLENVIQYESAKASLSVLQGRKDEYKEVYSVFAPLGATLKRIEREIDVNEEEYLELLRSLNEARMRQQNLEMTSNIKVVDEPYYPLTITGSNTKILMLAAAFLGFILVVFVILVLEYFDNSNRSPAQLRKATGLKMAGIFPDLGITDESIDLPYTISRLTEIIVQNLSLQLRHTSINKPVKPYFILIFSTQPESGKTTVGHHLKEKLESYESNVLYMNYKQSDDQEFSESEYIYDINNRFFEIDHVKQLLDSTALRSDNAEYDYILLEIPSIIHNSYPLDLMKTIDGSLIISKASETWKNADQMALENFMQVSNEEPMFILNQADKYAIDEMLHGVPRTGHTAWKRFKHKATAPFRVRIKFKDDEPQNQ
ncbi:MAG: LysM peptidoglycan-binding domain-containing protein [Bacteroidota bacterium]